MEAIRDLTNVKVGDKFMVERDYGFRGHYYVLAACTKVTPTQIEVDGDRYRKKDGKMVGGYNYLYVPDSKVLALGQAYIKARWFENMNWNSFTDQQKAEMYDIVQVKRQELKNGSN